MKDLEMKNSVLDEILGLMDGNIENKLKNHPKFKSAKVIIEKGPIAEGEEDIKEKAIESMMGDKKEMMPGHEMSESPEMESDESSLESELDNMSPEEMEMMLKKLKG